MSEHVSTSEPGANTIDELANLKLKEALLPRPESPRGFEYIVYKCILLILYVAYGIFRYLQYQFNRMKLRIYNVIYNPTNTPQLIRKDVGKLQKVPKKVAAILRMKPIGDVGGGLTGLINDASELVSWTACAGIKHLTLYNDEGLLQKNIALLRQEVHETLCKYYGPSKIPQFVVRIPHSNKVYYNVPIDESNECGELGHAEKKMAINILLLSSKDGRDTIVDLTKTMADLWKAKDLELSDITMTLVDKELIQLVGPEPDLILCFGPTLDIHDFPPWHMRLTELYWEPDNDEVTYAVFIRGLKHYSACKMNVGR